MGFSPCHVTTRTKLISRKHPQPVAYFLLRSKDDLGKQLLLRNAQLIERLANNDPNKGFVTGHDFSRAERPQERRWALAPAMSQPGRNSSPANILNPARTFFVTTKTSMSRRLLQSERNANLLIDVLRSLVAEQLFNLLDFVIMPDHFHALITVHDAMTIEKAMQLI